MLSIVEARWKIVIPHLGNPMGDIFGDWDQKEEKENGRSAGVHRALAVIRSLKKV